MLGLSLFVTSFAFMQKMWQAVAYTASINHSLYTALLPNLIIYSSILLCIYAYVYTKFGMIESGQETYNFYDALYFSIVTWTTVGYGDIAPTHGFSRVAASIEAITGYITMGLFMAGLLKMADKKTEYNSRDDVN